MKLRFVLVCMLLLLLGGMGAGGWWLIHRHPDPAVVAARAAGDGDLRPALALHRNHVVQEPASAAARLALARTLLQAGDGAAAEKSFRAAGPLGAPQWEVRLGIGDALSVQGAWAALLAEMPEQGPDAATTSRLLLLRGVAQVALAQLPAATATLAALRDVAPGRVEPLLLAARLAMMSGDPAGAEAETDAALKMDPALEPALLLKLSLLAARRDPALAGVLDRTIAAAPWSLAPRIARIGMLMDARQDERARAELGVLQARFPRAAPVRYLEAVLLARAGRLADADAAFDRLGAVAEIFPRAVFLHAAVVLAMGNTGTAVGLAGRYVARAPGDVEGIRLLARALLANDRPADAIAVLERAAEGPGARDVEVLNLLALAYTAVGDAPGALGARQKAAVLAPGDAGVATGLASSQLSQGNMNTTGLDLSLTMAAAP